MDETVGKVTLKMAAAGCYVSRAPKPYLCYKYNVRRRHSLTPDVGDIENPRNNKHEPRFVMAIGPKRPLSRHKGKKDKSKDSIR